MASLHGTGHWFGRATLDPDTPVVAGTHGTWKLVYTAGAYGVDNTGSILVCWRFASDWGRPQTDRPSDENYLTVSTTGRCRAEARYVFKGHIRPWYHVVWVDVLDGDLAPGEKITLMFGDTSEGSPGHRAQTAVEERSAWQVFVDPLNTRRFVPLDDTPAVQVVSGPAAKLEAVVPSQAVAGEPVSLLIRAFDVWGNVANGYEGNLSAACEPETGAKPFRVRLGPEDAGVKRVQGVTFAEPGIHRMRVAARRGRLTTLSNPCEVLEEPAGIQPYWGDLHGQSGEALGLGTVRDYYAFARDVAGIDFVSNQGNDFDIQDAGWRSICEATRESHEPGRFIPLLGYEWSGNTCAGGDHNVVFLGDDEPIRRSSHLNVTDGGDESGDCYPVTELYRAFAGRRDVLVIPHVGGRYANLSFHDKALEPLIEIHSGWGTFEWFLNDALARGHTVGFVAGSDDHKGRPGAAEPGTRIFGVRGGLTCIEAPELTRQDVFSALRERRCYATSGARIILHASCDGHPMGAVFESRKPPAMDVRIIGTAGIESVEILRFAEGDREASVVHSYPVVPKSALSTRFRVTWSGMKQIPRYFQTVWDGLLSISAGRIVSAEPFAFDTPLERITSLSQRSVAWKSQTTGDEDGLTLELDVPGDTILHFESGPVTFDVPVRDVGRESVVFPAGGVGQRVTLRRLPEGELPWEVAFGWRDSLAAEGKSAYFVRVAQEDGHKAWSSPAYVTYRP